MHKEMIEVESQEIDEVHEEQPTQVQGTILVGMSSSNSYSSSLIVVAFNTIIVPCSQGDDPTVKDDKKLKDEEKFVQPTSEHHEVDDEQGSTSPSLSRARMELLIAWASLSLVRNRFHTTPCGQGALKEWSLLWAKSWLMYLISNCRINMFSSCELCNWG